MPEPQDVNSSVWSREAYSSALSQDHLGARRRKETGRMKRQLAVIVALLLSLPIGAWAKGGGNRSLTPTRSSTIALTKKDSLLLVVNRETNSLGVLQVRKKKADTKTLLAEVAVGVDPRCVAVDAKG